VRGDVYRLRSPRRAKGHEQSGSRFAIVVQSDSLALSTWLVAPTSTSALAASFRPEIEVLGRQTRVLAEQTAAVDPQRLGEVAGHLTYDEMRRVDAALRVVLGLTGGAMRTRLDLDETLSWKPSD
jgi:mRNA interferase MazF